MSSLRIGIAGGGVGGLAAAYPPKPDLERPPWMPTEQELIAAGYGALITPLVGDVTDLASKVSLERGEQESLRLAIVCEVEAVVP